MGPGGAFVHGREGNKSELENTNRQDSQMDAFFDFENASGEHG
jgi:hypothetical protein